MIIDTMKISNRIIRNIEHPACTNCIYYKLYDNDLTSPLNKCEKFGVKNVVTDEITYKYADDCRRDENLCGNSGKYFEQLPKSKMALKKLKHRLLRPVNIIITITVVYLLAYYTIFLT